MKLYVMAASKKALNDKLARGEHVMGTNYSVFGGGGSYNLLSAPVGTVVSIFQKYVGGSPYAKAYGTIARDKAGRVVVK